MFGPDADSAYWNDLANEIAEVKVRGALQDRGYFNATEKVKLRPLKTKGTDISVVVTIQRHARTAISDGRYPNQVLGQRQSAGNITRNLAKSYPAPKRRSVQYRTCASWSGATYTRLLARRLRGYDSRAGDRG